MFLYDDPRDAKTFIVQVHFPVAASYCLVCCLARLGLSLAAEGGDA